MCSSDREPIQFRSGEVCIAEGRDGWVEGGGEPGSEKGITSNSWSKRSRCTADFSMGVPSTPA
jgi:hypothetical protein